MQSKDELREIDIKNRVCCYFNDIINDIDIKFNDILLDEKLYHLFQVVLHSINHNFGKSELIHIILYL